MITAKQAFMQSLGIDEDTYNAKMENVYGEINKVIECSIELGHNAVTVNFSDLVRNKLGIDIAHLCDWMIGDIVGEINKPRFNMEDVSTLGGGTEYHIRW